MSRWEAGALALVVVLIVGTIVLYSGRANAAPTFKGQGDNGPIVLVLLQDACKDEKVLRHINQPFHAKLKAARLTWGGRQWSSCWIELEMMSNGRMEKFVFSVDEEGSPLQAIPRRAFRDHST